MKKIIILSDTHQNNGFFKLFINKLKDLSPDLIIHLGDNYEDMDRVIKKGFSVIRVPGIWSSYYQNPMIDNRRFEDIEGWRFFLSHTIDSDEKDILDDPRPEEVIKKRNCDIFCYGHSHISELMKRNGIIFLNPGHMYQKINKGFPPSFAILEINDKDVEIKIEELLSGKLVKKEVFRRD